MKQVSSPFWSQYYKIDQVSADFVINSPVHQPHIELKPIQSNKTFLSQAACSFKQGNKGSLKTFLFTVSNDRQILQRSGLTNYRIGLLADKVHLNKHKCLQVLHLPYTNQKTSTVSCQITLNNLQTLICIGRDTCF